MISGFMRILGFTTLSTAGLLLISPAAAAAERGFYVGGFYGQTDSGLGKEGLDALSVAIYESDVYQFEVQQFTSTLDTKDSGYGFFAGYRLYNHLAFEGGFVDMGKLAYRNQAAVTRSDIGDLDLSQSLTVKSSGIMLSALGILPLTYRSEVFVRGGVVFTTNEIKGSISDGVVTESLGKNSDSDTDWLLGVGAGLTFAEVYTLRLEYQRLLDAGNTDIWGEADIDMISLGVVVSF